MNRRGAQAGFSMMEVMVTTAAIGVVVKLALPSLASSSRKATGDSEVQSFMTELRLREEQYHVENGRYLSTGTSDTNTFPATPSPTVKPLGTLPASWTSLRLRTPDAGLRCGYVVIAGTPASSPGTMATTTFGWSKPATDWYYAIAHCNLDGNSATDSYYFASSTDTTIKKQNPGK